jgi:hypothetical protein
MSTATATATPTPGVVNGHTHSSPYVYTPSAPANIAFLVIFAYAAGWFISDVVS